MPEFLYHYTDSDGKYGILRNQFIAVSEDTNKDAILGEGVYLTHLPPWTSRNILLRNNYGDARYGQEHKITHFVRIPADRLGHIQKKKFGKRVIYVCPYPIDLQDISDAEWGRKSDYE